MIIHNESENFPEKEKPVHNNGLFFFIPSRLQALFTPTMGLIELDIPPGRVFFINSALPDKVFQRMLLTFV